MIGDSNDLERARYELELNQLRYELSQEKKRSEKLHNELRRLRGNRVYRLARVISHVLRLGTWPLRKYRHVRDLRDLKKRELWLAKLHATLTAEAEAIPVSNGSRFYKKFPLNLAIITDEYIFNYYKDSFENVYWLTPETWEQVFRENRIDLFLYVSCWRGGLQSEWRGHLRIPSLIEVIDSILETCRAKGIKSVFQSIEDPSNFAHFLPLAQKFPYIYTSDADIVNQYRSACPQSEVRYGEYGINPIFNNPIGMLKNQKYHAFFAGSYPKRYEDRCWDMETLFDSVLNSGLSLVIADRNSEFNLPEYRFPERYQSAVISAFPHKLLQSVHKLFAFNLNLNSIKSSSTMCAMRVYELQAQGTQILSNYAKSIANKFPGIDIVSYPKGLSFYLKNRERFESCERRIRSIRNVLSSKTAYQQIRKMLVDIDLWHSEENKPKLLAITEKGSRQEGLVGICEEIIVDYIRPAELNLVALNNYDYMAFFSDEYRYEPFYIRDMLNAFKYVDVPFITRCSYFLNGVLVEGPQHDYTWGVPDKYLTLYSLRDSGNDFLGKISAGKLLGMGYSVDGLGVNCEEYFDKLASIGRSSPTLSIIVPVYNNGVFLRDRCFESLFQQHRFNEFEIILIDDCSDDIETKGIIKTLGRRYPNVKVYSFEGAPSGSASRSRNKGIELSVCKYITFLDPDNAISPGGYDNLLAIIERQEDLDAVFGFQLKITSGGIVKIGCLYEESSTDIRNPGKEVILKKNFPVISTQAAVIKRKFLVENKISFIEGAVGQDTTFGYELLLCASKVKFVHDAYLEYYAERFGSVTNIVDRSFFEKSLLLERAQCAIMKKYGCWEEYRILRAKNFIVGWYMPKLELVDNDEYSACSDLVAKIAEINEVDLNERVMEI